LTGRQVDATGLRDNPADRFQIFRAPSRNSFFERFNSQAPSADQSHGTVIIVPTRTIAKGKGVEAMAGTAFGVAIGDRMYIRPAAVERH
jgi:hypothetical protein